ncbi:MAG: NUDIX domain-containing protein [Gammaproteobacteria bacterium]|nr:NUDIX domain-containing protein [Gammaproteobacteria bacterium]
MRDTFPVIVHTLLWRANALLLLRRAYTGFLDGYYALPGGHLEAGEGVIDCAIRECREEVGIALPRAAVHPLGVLPYRGAGGQGVDFFMTCDSFADEPRLAEPERFDELRWVHPERLPHPSVPYLAKLLQMRKHSLWFAEFDG